MVALSPIGISRGRHHVRPVVRARRTTGYTLNWGMAAGLLFSLGVWAGAGLLLARWLHLA